MPEYSADDLKKAAEFREEIHGEALAKVRAVYPCADRVVDKYPPDAYFQQVWDYPGQWYTVIATPPGAGSRKDLVGAIVRQTLEYCRAAEEAYSAAEFHRMLAEYPDIVCDYRIVSSGDQSAKAVGVFPYRGVESHRLALECAARDLFAEGEEWAYDIKSAKCKKLKNKALFAPEGADGWLNYRRAFLSPPHGNSYTDDDFERFNAVLFPGGPDGLEVYRWTTDWSEYFDEGHEWWGALCLTVYDGALDRFVIVMASASD